MQEQDKKQREIKHQKMMQRIKKVAQTEDLGSKTVTYGRLEKKNNSGTGSNSRIFFLIHKSKIGYLNELGKEQYLPIGTAAALPAKFKNEILLDNIEKISNEKDMLKIVYNKSNKKETWEFKCPDVNQAKYWFNFINASIDELKNDKLNPPKAIVVDSKVSEEQAKKLATQQNKQKVNKADNGQGDKKQGQAVDPEQKVQDQQKKQPGVEPNDPNRPQGDNSVDSPAQAPVFGQKQEKPEILKPKSTLFVGGISVNSEKDQQQLKNKMQTFQTLTSKIKQQYQRKKQQQRNMHESLTPHNLAVSLLSLSTDSKFQIEKMQRSWGYEFAKSTNEYEIVEKFKLYVETVTRKLIDELGLEEKKRYYQPQHATANTFIYEINGVMLSVFLTELKQINQHAYSFAEKGTVVSNECAKLSRHEFKNYEYILRLTANKGKIRVPLSMVTHYKGITAYAKVMIPTAQAYDKMDALEKQLQILEAQSHINNSIFQDPEPDSCKILALQSKAYEKLARAENINKKFDLCFIDGLKHYLPQDYNNFSKDRVCDRLRWQLIQDGQCEDKILYGEDMCAISNRLKLPQYLRDGINQLSDISKLIFSRIDLLVAELQSADEFFTNSHQLSQIMHKHGVNMRYLGLLHERLTLSWLKQTIMSQICARCAKKYHSFDLQDCLLNLAQSSIENVHKFQVKQTVSFLNKMLGNSQDSDVFWKQLNRQSQSQFKVSINREQLNQVYLLQAIQHHCCIRLVNMEGLGQASPVKQVKNDILGRLGSKVGLLNTSGVSNLNISLASPTKNSRVFQLFQTPNPITPPNIGEFTHRSTSYDLSFTQLYNSVSALINQPSVQSYQQLRILLNLPRIQCIPTHFKLSAMYQKILLFIINWLPPSQAYTLYYPEEIQLSETLPSRLLYMLKLGQIRWGLKEGNVDEMEKVKQWVVDHVNRWVGDCHPVLTELYEIYANYYLLFRDEEKRAVNYCKSAIKNQEKIIGAYHLKMADSYYLLGTIYRHYGKKTESINSLKKAKEIILKSNNQDSEAYGEVCLKMGQLFLALNLTADAKDEGMQAMKILEKSGNSEVYMQAIELVCRCLELDQDWSGYLNLIESTLVHKVAYFVDDVELTEKIIKACIYPNLRIISDTSSSVTQKILKILGELPESTRAPNMAYNFLRLRIQQGLFPHKFLESLMEIEQILEQIDENGMLTRWKGFQSLSNKSLLNKVGVNIDNRGFNFIATLEAVNIFLGTSFFQGVLNGQ